MIKCLEPQRKCEINCTQSGLQKKKRKNHYYLNKKYNSINTQKTIYIDFSKINPSRPLR